MLGWIYFRSNDIFQANTYITQLFNFSTSSYSVVTYLSMTVILAMVFGILCAGFLQRPLQKVYAKVATKLPVLIADYAWQFVLLALSILMLISGTYNPFIYFQF